MWQSELQRNLGFRARMNLSCTYPAETLTGQFRHFRTNFAFFHAPNVTPFEKQSGMILRAKILFPVFQHSTKFHFRINKSDRSVLHAHTFRDKIDHIPYLLFHHVHSSAGFVNWSRINETYFVPVPVGQPRCDNHLRCPWLSQRI